MPKSTRTKTTAELALDVAINVRRDHDKAAQRITRILGEFTPKVQRYILDQVTEATVKAEAAEPANPLA